MGIIAKYFEVIKIKASHIPPATLTADQENIADLLDDMVIVQDDIESLGAIGAFDATSVSASILSLTARVSALETAASITTLSADDYEAGTYSSVYSSLSARTSEAHPVLPSWQTLYTADAGISNPYFVKVSYTMSNIIGSFEDTVLLYLEDNSQSTVTNISLNTIFMSVDIGNCTDDDFNIMFSSYNDTTGTYVATITGIEVAPATEI